MDSNTYLQELKDKLSDTNQTILIRSLDSVESVEIKENKITFNVTDEFSKDTIKESIKEIERLSSGLLDGNFSVKINLIKGKNAVKLPSHETTKKTDDKVKKNDVNKKVQTNEEVINPEIPRLNPKYTLDNFIPGENSRFAYNIAKAIAANPASEYNPFLIYSNVGLGKTHLAEAIGNEIKNTLKYKVMYVTCEYFINEYIKSIEKKTPEQYKNIYRNVDVLIIDDVQFLEGKPSTQESLFNIFNSLKDANKQMIFTSDRPLNAIKEFQLRLSTRLNSGVAADLQPPPYETKVAILRSKCKLNGYDISDDIINYIAENITSNVRDLEACLNRLVPYSRLIDQKITIENAKNTLKDLIFISKDLSNVSIEKIIKTVADYYDVPSIDLRGKKKNKSINEPRQIAFYLAHDITQLSLTEIGTYFGNRDHSTVLHSINKIKNKMKEDTTLSETIKMLSNNIIRES